MHKNTSAIIVIITNAIFIIVAVCLESQLRDKCHRYNLGLNDDFGKLLSDLGILGPHWGLDSTSQLTLLCGMPLVSLPIVFMGGKALTVQCSGSWSRLLNTISCVAVSFFFTHFFLKWAGIFFFFLRIPGVSGKWKLMVEEIALTPEWVVFLIFALWPTWRTGGPAEMMYCIQQCMMPMSHHDPFVPKQDTLLTLTAGI